MNSNQFLEETVDSFPEDFHSKVNALLKAFSEIGWNAKKELGEEEILYFLNQKTTDGLDFDIALAKKLLDLLEVEGGNKRTVEDFCRAYVQFESDLKKNSEDFMKKLEDEKTNYSTLEQQCNQYKSEKLNEEGFCSNAKVTVEITDVNVQRKLEGIKSLSIQLIYNDAFKERSFQAGNRYAKLNERFEFKPTSRKDHFEFVMKGTNDSNNEFLIGSKVFPLDEVTSQEEYAVTINVPELEDETKIAAYINAKIIVYWSDFQYFDNKRKKCLNKMRKLQEAINKSNIYLSKIRATYGDLSRNESNNKLKAPKIFQMDDIEYIDDGKAIEEYLNMSTLNLIKILSVLIFSLGLLSSIWRPDFVNECMALGLFLGAAYACKSGLYLARKILRYLVWILTLTLIYDGVWVFSTETELDQYTGGHEDKYARLSMILAYANVGLKALCLLLLCKGRSGLNNGESLPLQNKV